MAYIDHGLQLSDGQALTATAVSTNVIDLGYENADAGTGTPMFVVVKPTVALATGTVQVQVQQSADEAFSSPEVITQSAVLSTLDEDNQLVLPIPPHNGRYLRLNYVIASSGTVTVDAAIQLDYQKWRSYPAEPFVA